MNDSDDIMLFNINAMTFLCSLELLRDKLKNRLVHGDIQESIKIAGEIERTTKEFGEALKEVEQ